jgi:glycosyltransferase involved in cell wall biosynthesis
VIASNVGGIAEYVTHKVNGYLFERGSSIDLGQVLQEVVNDISQLEQVRANIPNVKSIYNEVDEIEKIYHQMLLR